MSKNGSEHDDFDTQIQVEEVYPSEEEPINDNRRHICIFCKTSVIAWPLEIAVNKGWEPDAWSEKCNKEVGPICNKCNFKISNRNDDSCSRFVKSEFDSETLANKGDWTNP